MKKIFRQGDVLLIKTTKKNDLGEPIKAESGRMILARGEATGHHHSVDAAVCAGSFAQRQATGLH